MATNRSLLQTIMLSSFRRLPSYVAPLRLLIRQSSNEATMNPKKEDLKWDIVAAVSLERLPVVTPSQLPLEASMTTYLAAKEVEQSMLCDHELHHIGDLDRQERKRRGEWVEGEEDIVTKTALDLEDDWRKGASGFQAADRETEADRQVDVKSVSRMLHKTLKLIGKYKLGEEEYWDLPWVVRKDGETLRETAERAVRERCGEGLETQILGNAPGSFYKYKYPKWYREKVEKQGAKVWIYKGYLMNHYLSPPCIELGEDLVDFRWASSGELEQFLDKNTFKALSNMSHADD
jgi:large subunit ribosomal protein L46